MDRAKMQVLMLGLAAATASPVVSARLPAPERSQHRAFWQPRQAVPAVPVPLAVKPETR